jgi:hypothetical protein
MWPWVTLAGNLAYSRDHAEEELEIHCALDLRNRHPRRGLGGDRWLRRLL